MFFWLHAHFLLPTILTMMHLCIMLYTYWTPLLIRPTRRPTAYRPPLGGPKIALDGMGSARVVLKSWLRAWQRSFDLWYYYRMDPCSCHSVSISRGILNKFGVEKLAPIFPESEAGLLFKYSCIHSFVHRDYS